MTITDLFRRERFLNRFSWHAQDYPGYVKLKRDLRREVTATAADTGMASALASLGNPRDLAAQYLADLDRPQPRWSTATWWAGAGLCILTWIGISYGLGAMDALAASGGGTAQLAVFGTPVTFVFTASEISSRFTFTGSSLAWFLGVTVVPYLLGARIWRLWTARPA